MVQLRLRSKVGPKGQAVIPKPIRDALGMHPGSEIYFTLGEGQAVVEPEGGDNAWDRLMNLVKDKTPEPEYIDWDALNEGRF